MYKSIEKALNSDYEANLKYFASLPPAQAAAAAPSLNLSRDSPFGSFSQNFSRRTFAYAIATLNASHEDYDFSYAMKPSDFTREKSLSGVMNTLDQTLYNLRPRSIRDAGPSHWSCSVSPTGPPALGGGELWSPKMWHIIDQEMDLKSCSIYLCDPDFELWDPEVPLLWTYNYLFFNQRKKRVCYIWLRGSSMMSYSPVPVIQVPMKHKRVLSDQSVGYGSGSSKRAKYWLGDKVGGRMEREWGEDYNEADDVQYEEVDDDELAFADEEEEEEAEVDEAEDEKAEGEEAKSKEVEGKGVNEKEAKGEDAKGKEAKGKDAKEKDVKGDETEVDEEDPELSPTPASEKSGSKSPVRGVSEDAVETMEI